MSDSTTAEAPIKIGNHTQDIVRCANCNMEGVVGDFFTYQTKDGSDTYLCSDCRVKANETLEAEKNQINMVYAAGLGIVAAIAGGIAWYYVTLLTNMEFGYAALGLGYLVGYAVFIGAGKRRGQKLQILSVVLTLLSIFWAEYFIFSHGLFEYMSANPSQFDWWDGAKIWLDPWSSIFLETFISPISALIYAIGLYVAYTVCKPQKL